MLLLLFFFQIVEVHLIQFIVLVFIFGITGSIFLSEGSLFIFVSVSIQSPL